MNECIYRTPFKERFKKTYKKRGYSQVSLAIELNVSVDTVKKWLRKDTPLPSIDYIKSIADLLKVDTAYLLGEQDCERNTTQTICDVTYLDESAADTLINCGEITSSILNELLVRPDFQKLLLDIFFYAHSHNTEITITDRASGEKSTVYLEQRKKEMLKFTVTDQFGKIIDSIYDTHTDESNVLMIGKIFDDIIHHAKNYNESFSDTDAPEKEKACRLTIEIIQYYIDRIRELDPDSKFGKVSAEYYIENVDILEKGWNAD